MRLLGRLVTKFPKFIIAAWIVVFFVLAVFAIRLPGKLHGDGFSIKGEYAAVMEELTTTFQLPSHSIFIVFYEKTDQQIASIMDKLSATPDMQSVKSPLTSPEQHKDHISYAILHFDDQAKDMPQVVDSLRKLLAGEDNVSVTGAPVLSNDINKASQKDLASAEAIGLPIALIVLLLAFGSVVASLLPIVIGVFTVVAAFGTMALLSLNDNVDLSIFILNIVPMLGLALSIDFALLFINRYREERAQSSVSEAVQTTIRTAGRSILFSALCVMIGLGAMVVIRVEIFLNIALGGTIVVAMAVLTGLTLLPALICILQDKLNKWTIIRVKPSTSGWQRIAKFVMKHPVLIACSALLLLGAGLIPAKEMKLTIPALDSLPTSYESRTAFEDLQKQFELGQHSIVYVLAERERGWKDTEGLTKLLDIQHQLAADSRVKHVSTLFTESNIDSVEAWQLSSAAPQAAAMLTSLQDRFIQGNQLFIPVTLHTNSTAPDTKQFLYTWMDKDIGVPFQLGGDAKFNQEIFDETSNKIWIAIAIIMVTTFFILMIAFRSLLIPLKAILMNVIGLGSTFGILVYIFQYGHLGMEAGTLSLIIPVIVFCLVFGLSMDYEVFLISRIQEEYELSGDNTQATILGLTSTSKIITSAALIMIVITGAFAFTSVIPVKQIGVGIAIAVAIDATIIRLMLVPSLMKLLGDWNWWLPFRKRNVRAKH